MNSQTTPRAISLSCAGIGISLLSPLTMADVLWSLRRLLESRSEWRAGMFFACLAIAL
jgi:hypothetical protein